MRNFFITAFLAVAILVPTLVFGQEFGSIVPCSGAECQACNLVQLGDNIIKFLISIFSVVGAILIMWAGILMATSAGNTSQREKGKGILTNTVIGLLIMLTAWLVVHTIMQMLAGDAQLDMWEEIQCVGLPEYTDTETLVSPDANPIPMSEIPDTPTEVVVNADNNFSYQPGISAQKSHASGALNSLLSCMSGKVSGDVGQISSISDSYIVNGSKTWEQCAGGQCQHKAGSCHYGGTSCVGRSYAVDFGDEWNASALSVAAKSCGATFVGNEGNHLHVSVGSGCGCN